MQEYISFRVKDPENNSCPTKGWEGRLYPIELDTQPYEASMQIRGWSYHLIFGEQCDGWFVCIPEWGIGAGLGVLANLLWNQCSLISKGVDKETALCIADALAVLNDYI